MHQCEDKYCEIRQKKYTASPQLTTRWLHFYICRDNLENNVMLDFSRVMVRCTFIKTSQTLIVLNHHIRCLYCIVPEAFCTSTLRSET